MRVVVMVPVRPVRVVPVVVVRPVPVSPANTQAMPTLSKRTSGQRSEATKQNSFDFLSGRLHAAVSSECVQTEVCSLPLPLSTDLCADGVREQLGLRAILARLLRSFVRVRERSRVVGLGSEETSLAQ